MVVCKAHYWAIAGVLSTLEVMAHFSHRCVNHTIIYSGVYKHTTKLNTPKVWYTFSVSCTLQFLQCALLSGD